MKQSLAALIVLLLILAAGLYSAHSICVLTDSVSAQAAAAEKSALSGDFASAVSELEQAAQRWESAKKYTYVLTRHAAVDAVSDVLSDALAELYDENAAAAQGVFRKLRTNLTAIADMENIRFGTLF